MFTKLYEEVLKETYEKSTEILDILQVFFLQAMATDRYEVSTEQVLEFIHEKLMVSLSFEELREVLESVATVEAVDEEKISLYDPESMEAEMGEEDDMGLPDTTSEEDEQAEEEEKQEDDMVKAATDTALKDLEKGSKLQ